VASSARCRVESGAFTEDTAMENDIPEDSEDETLDDYEAGFLDGLFAARGIENPTEEQLAEAFQMLDDFIERHQSEE